MFLSNFISIYTYIYLHDIFLIENFYHAFRKNFLLNLHKIGSTYNIHVFEYIAAKFSHISRIQLDLPFYAKKFFFWTTLLNFSHTCPNILKHVIFAQFFAIFVK